MSRLSSISSNPTLQAYAQGAAQEATAPVADFIAPTVDVPTSVGRYKIYTEASRFKVPDTLRALGGRATEISFDAADGTYNCQPHALDYPVDNLEQLEAAGLENVIMEGASAIAEIAALSHEQTVINAALAAAGSGTGKTWNSSADPVNDIDTAILSVLLAAKYGSLMGVGVLFGAGAWRIFKNSAGVRAKFVVGSTGKGGAAYAIPTEEGASSLFVGNPEIRTSFMVADSAGTGVSPAVSFLLNNTVMIFARKANPTRRDPSFMKTFRLMNQWMKPGSYSRDDGRVEVAKFDWSEDVQVTNATAVQRLNISES